MQEDNIFFIETGSDVFGNRRLLSNTSMFYDGDVENDAAMNGEETNQVIWPFYKTSR
jgi:hypothetical protein